MDLFKELIHHLPFFRETFSIKKIGLSEFIICYFKDINCPDLFFAEFETISKQAVLVGTYQFMSGALLFHWLDDE